MEPSNPDPDYDGTLKVPHPPINEQPISPPGDAQPPVPVVSPDIAPGTPAVVSGDFSAPAAMPTPVPAVSAGFEPASAYPPPPAPLPPSPQPFFSAPTPPAAPVFGGGDPLMAPAPLPGPSPGKRPAKSLLMALAAVLVIGIGSAAAYVGVIVPNKPANVLKAAFINSLQQKQSSSSGTISASSSGLAYKVTFSSAEDAVAKAADFQINLTVSGVTFPVETRLVNQNLYIRVGDLGTIAGLVNAYVPTAGATVKSLSSALSNKWIIVDSTLLNENSGVKCALNSSWTLTNADIQLLGAQYGKHPFATIQSTSSGTVGGKPAEKFDLSISNAALNDFGNGVVNLSVLKNLGKCLGGTSMSTPSTDHGHTPLTVWVDKGSKRIVQIANNSGDPKSGTSISTTITLNYGKVSITAPRNAEPAVQVLTSIQSTLGGSGIDLTQLLSSATGTQSQAKDTKRQTDILSLQTQLEAYFSQNGNYPSLSEMNNAGWRQAHMSSLDSNAMQDPDGASTSLAATPRAKVYAYQVRDSKGASCEADATQCAKYTLTATFSTGKTYTKQNLD